jgi:hypothetical protein
MAIQLEVITLQTFSPIASTTGFQRLYSSAM